MESGLVALLYALQPERFVELLRDHQLVYYPDSALVVWAASALARLGLGDSETWELLARLPRPPLDELLADPIADARLWLEIALHDPETSPADQLRIRSRLSRWPGDATLLPAVGELPEVRDAIRRGDWAAIEARLDELGSPSHAGDCSEYRWMQVALRALAGDVAARADFWSAARAGRYRWIHHRFDKELFTLGFDSGTLPHWVNDLESNCCRISDGLGHRLFAWPFQEAVPGRGMSLEVGNKYGVGLPLSVQARLWHGANGGAWEFSPLLEPGRWVIVPD